LYLRNHVYIIPVHDVSYMYSRKLRTAIILINCQELMSWSVSQNHLVSLSCCPVVAVKIGAELVRGGGSSRVDGEYCGRVVAAVAYVS
jgi:hypothetical protein